MKAAPCLKNHSPIGHLPFLAVVAAMIALTSAVMPTAFGTVIWTNPITDTNPSATNPYTNGQTFDSNLTVSGIGRAGLTASSAANRFSATNYTTAASRDTTKYFNWTLQPVSGFRLSFTSLDYNQQHSSTGPTSFSLYSSLDSFATAIATYSIVSGTVTAVSSSIDLSAAAFQNLTTPIEFRLYGFAAGATSGTYSINDFTFNGSVVPVPEPATVLGGVLAVIGVAWTQRRRFAGGMRLRCG